MLLLLLLLLQITSLKVDAIIRGGLRRFTDMIGQLWCSLADYYIRSGHFDRVSLVVVTDRVLTPPTPSPFSDSSHILPIF